MIMIIPSAASSFQFNSLLVSVLCLCFLSTELQLLLKISTSFSFVTVLKISCSDIKKKSIRVPHFQRLVGFFIYLGFDLQYCFDTNPHQYIDQNTHSAEKAPRQSLITLMPVSSTSDTSSTNFSVLD